MKILDLFDEYFLILVWIQSGVLVFMDNKNFIRNKMKKEAMISKKVGYGAIVLSSVLYIARLILV